MFKQFVDCNANVLGDQSKQDGRNVPPGMKWDGRGAAVGMTELLVRAALTHFNEAESREKCDDFSRLEDRNPGHLNDYGMGPDELGLQLGFAVLEQHGDYLAEIRM